MKRNRSLSLGYDTLRLEGALLLPDVLEKAAHGTASHQTTADYHTPKGFNLQEEYGRAFRIAQAQWKAFASTLDRQDLDAAASTRQFVEEFLRDALGYADLRRTDPVQLGERRFPIDAMAAGCVPIVIAPHMLDLDEPAQRFAPEGGGARKKSAFQLTQEFLNTSPDHAWALACNGRRIRLLRDAATLTRPSFLEFDLEAILAEARYPDFAALWRVLHASRIGTRGNIVWEVWRTEGQQEGARVREGLREGVTQALVMLGEGFLQHAANEALRRALIDGTLTKEAYFQQLLRLIYRCIFLFAVEERGLLHPRDDRPQAVAARRIYTEGYSAARLRDRCLRRVAHDTHDDLWQGLTIVFHSLAQGEPRLALPALGGLFALDQCRDLDAMSLSNRALLNAMRQLRWSNRSGSLAPVDYRNMGPEELGSVYESLLELVPDTDPHARRFGFVGLETEGSTQGNARKTSGSYYTPDSLVQELIKSALDPIIEERIQAQPGTPTEALLSITVVDPACGSGHFLLAAARRLAERLAQLRAPEGAVKAADYRHALREVVSHCIYGVDRNPMALELARFALWLEGFEEGRPLGFLDHHLVCGDALIGITDLAQLTHGIPDAAFKPLSGDDKAVCKEIAKENKEGLKAFAKLKSDQNLPLALARDTLIAKRAALEAMPDDSLEQAHAKQVAWASYAAQERGSRLAQAADLLVGAFLATKAGAEAPVATPTSKNLYLALHTDKAPEDLPEARQAERIANAQKLAANARALHWPLTFVQVFAKGGFDCVLGNPPWERIKLQEEEFFATRHPLVAQAKNKAERSRRIEWLAQGALARHLYPELEHPAQECEAEQRLYDEFITARRIAEAASVFAHLEGDEGGRYPLTGVGDVNTYALFAESISQIVSKHGRAGFIVPTGIATDDSTKAYFAEISQSGRLVSLYDFENRDGIFPGVHRSYKFCLITLGQNPEARFAFFLTQVEQLGDERRQFTLTPEDFRLINPNTRTCPVFRSQRDAELTKKIYHHAPVLIEESTEEQTERNPWGIRFMTMFHMSNDSHLFASSDAPGRLPLYEAKMIHQFDHRWASYRVNDGGEDSAQDVPLADKQSPAFTIRPRYWVEAREVYLRTANLPKVLLMALSERNEALIVLGMAHLLFGKWLLQKGFTSVGQAMQGLYPAWCDFVMRYPFAQSIAPTQLGLCGKNPACLKPAGHGYLPTVPVDQIKNAARQSTAWHFADEKAVSVFLDAVSGVGITLDPARELKAKADVLAYAENCLRQAAPTNLMGWRRNARSNDERTTIASILPLAGVGDSIFLLESTEQTRRKICLAANLNCMVLDFVARQKVGGMNYSFYYMRQMSVLSPDIYTEADLAFIVPRALELTYAAHDLKAWSEDLGHSGPPFPFDPDRRALLRAELDAYYARLYGLTRDELRYILDPADVMGPDYPSETFRVLKNKEEKEFGEYRTSKWVLREFDRMVLAEASRRPYETLLDPLPGVQAAHTYSDFGVIRGADDARLAGFVLTLIREAPVLPRQDLSLALEMMQRPKTAQPYLNTTEAIRLDELLQAVGNAFTPSSVGRAHEMLRYLETDGAIRVEERGASLRAVQGSRTPAGIEVASGMPELAQLVLKAVAGRNAMQQATVTDTAVQPTKQA
jgi:hypothetical protein